MVGAFVDVQGQRDGVANDEDEDGEKVIKGSSHLPPCLDPNSTRGGVPVDTRYCHLYDCTTVFTSSYDVTQDVRRLEKLTVSVSTPTGRR